jgi:hypothetical protein
MVDVVVLFMVDGGMVVMVAVAVLVMVDGGMVVVQPGPSHLEILMSPQFQNFSAPLLLVLGSTTAAEHDGRNGFHHATSPLTAPPNLEVIQDCVELWLKYSGSPAGLHEFAVTQNH